MSRETLITGGPNNMDLMMSLFSTQKQPHFVFFSTPQGETLKMRIRGLDQEDESGESWNITALVELPGPLIMRTELLFYYSAKNRRGHINI